jgi:thiosulfate/3-mercaptopyruvate sulfurtransferase
MRNDARLDDRTRSPGQPESSDTNKPRSKDMRRQIASIMAVSLLAFAGMGIAAAQQPIELVEAEWLKANLDNQNVRIVDVSGRPDTFNRGHIPGAVQVKRHIDLGDLSKSPPSLYPSQEQFEQLMARLGISPDTTVVAYDDAFSLYAARLLFIMELYGHDTGKLKLLNGGSVHWKALNYPMSTEAVAPPAATYKVADTRMDRRLMRDDVLRAVLGDKPGVMIHDARPAAEYKAENIRSIRGGHIPGAINVTGADAVAENHMFKPIDEIRAMYEEAGFTGDKEIYTYCHSGDRSAHAYITMKHFLGYENVRSYDGSWIEWSTDLTLPAAGQVWVWSAK